MLVQDLQLPGYGGQAALPPGQKPSDYPGIDYRPPPPPPPPPAPPNGNGGGNGANGGTPWAPSVGIPDNFWGFVMLTMGLR